jgi:hypothetical protein
MQMQRCTTLDGESIDLEPRSDMPSLDDDVPTTAELVA